MSERAASSDQLFGRYRLLEPMTKGGMAEVWRAKLVGAKSFERPMVIKRILPHLCDDPAFVKMFVAEARLSAMLHHPNIVQVFELGDVDGELFMALEYVVGVDLARLLQAMQAPLPIGLAAFIAHEILRALSYAHGLVGDDGTPLTIVHRDVSPSNVLIGYDGQVRLCDFGIAKALGATVERSRTGAIKGKLGYMAPEVFDGAAFDQRCDLFAAGVVLHEMLTGARLFKADTELRTMALVNACAVAPPSQKNPLVTPQLDRLTLKLLARDPRDRYATADDVLAELGPLLHDLRWGAAETKSALVGLVPPTLLAEPSATVSARRSPSDLSLAKTSVSAVRRRRATLAAALTVIVLVTTALVLTLARHSRSTSTETLPQPTPRPVVVTPLPANELPTPAQPSSPPVETRPTQQQATQQQPNAEPPTATETRGSDAHAIRKRKHKRPINIERGDVLDKL